MWRWGADNAGPGRAVRAVATARPPHTPFNKEVTLMAEIAQAISNYGFSVVLLAWMIYKDWKFNTSLDETLSSVRDALSSVNATLAKLEAYHDKEVK